MKKCRIVPVFILAALVLTGCKSMDYEAAVGMTQIGDWTTARRLFEALDTYKDSPQRLISCDYHIALKLMEKENYAEAAKIFEALGEYQDSKDLLEECKRHMEPVQPPDSSDGFGFSVFMI